jgi:hypothetical protein
MKDIHDRIAAILDIKERRECNLLDSARLQVFRIEGKRINDTGEFLSWKEYIDLYDRCIGTEFTLDEIGF